MQLMVELDGDVGVMHTHNVQFIILVPHSYGQDVPGVDDFPRGFCSSEVLGEEHGCKQ